MLNAKMIEKVWIDGQFESRNHEVSAVERGEVDLYTQFRELISGSSLKKAYLVERYLQGDLAWRF
jgi:hypothetical protein